LALAECQAREGEKVKVIRKREGENEELLHDNAAGTLSPVQQGSAKLGLHTAKMSAGMTAAAI
jgi:hypothetical protein